MAARPGRSRPLSYTTAALALLLLISSAAQVAPRAAGGQGAGPAPAVEVAPATVAVDQQVLVYAFNWSPSTLLVAEVCGNEAKRGSIDCDVTRSGARTTGADGAASVRLVVGSPPVGCPCVVRVHEARGETVATTPVTITGLGDLPTPSHEAVAPIRRLEVVEVSLGDGDGNRFAQLFGTPSPRRLEITVRNTGNVTVASAALALRLHGGDRAPSLIRAPEIPALAAGEQERLAIEFDLPALAWGTYSVSGRVDGGDVPATFTAETSASPWGLPAVPAAAVLLVLAWWWHRRLTGRKHKATPAVGEAVDEALSEA